MTNPTTHLPRSVNLADLLEQLMLLEDIGAQAVVAALRAYCESLGIEPQVKLEKSKFLYEVVREVDLPEWWVSAIIDNVVLREYN